MSKIIPLLFAVSGAVATSVGGVGLLKQGQGKKSEGTSQEAEKLSADLGFKTLSDFKNNKGGECAKKYLDEFVYTEAGKASEDISLDASFFPTDGSDIKSCLVINWERTDSTNTSDGKGKGEFRWLGTFVKDKKAMVAFTIYKQHTADGQMFVEGGIYFLKKEGSPESWKIDKFKEHQSANENKKMISSTDFENSFPKKGEAIKTDFTVYGEESKEWGGFVKGKDDVAKICKSVTDDTACTTTGSTEKQFKGSGIGEVNSGESDTLDKWSSTPLTILCKLYGTSGTSSWPDPFTSLNGVWKEQNTTVVTGK